ncbi:MAG: hypothetical protein N3G18_09165 [Candidatus Saccharicenans sp.]|nr:hypothetical protein [Candidatus Saccharicenans sp.]
MIKKILLISMIGLYMALAVVEAKMSGQDGGAQVQQPNLRRNLVTLRALRMTQVLELTEQQTAVIFPELNRAEKEKAEMQKQLAAEIGNLRQKISSGKTPDEEFETGVLKIRELRRKIQAREQAFEDFLFNQLTPVQKARYIIFSLEFNRAIMERAQRLRQAGQKIK